MKNLPLFIAIQLASFILFMIGWIIIPPMAYARFWYQRPATKNPWTPGIEVYQWRGGKLTWLWCNEEDGICAKWYGDPITPKKAMLWSAWRNSSNNLRFVPGVSKVGRELHHFTLFGRKFKWGWLSDGYPVLSRDN